MNEAWEKNGDEVFEEMLDKGYVIRIEGDNAYIIGEEPSLTEEND